MNPTVVKALCLDALHQVLDNRVFRILAVLVLIPILIAFLISFKEDHVSLLFGWKKPSYDGIFEFFGASTAGIDTRTACIEGLLQGVFNIVAGTFGVLFCIAATAFFVPRMIEKGAADVLFHKPLSRWTFFCAQYFAGLLFVGILSLVLVSGVFLGLLTMSGYYDLGIFWAAPILVYLFGLIHPVSMLVAILTRSTVAAILLTILFFFGNGCIHGFWILKETLQAAAEVPREQERERARELANEEDEDTNANEPEDEDDANIALKLLIYTLDTVHYVLPKTGDADLIASDLRRKTRSVLFEDEENGFLILECPDGMIERSLDDVERSIYSDELNALLGEPFFAIQPETGENEPTFTFWRRPRRQLEPTGRNTRPRTEKLQHAAKDLKELLEKEVKVNDLQRFSEGLPARGKFASKTAIQLTWVDDDGKLREHVRLTTFGLGDDIFSLEMRLPEEAYEEELFDEQLRDFSQYFGVESQAPGQNQDAWYTKQFGWDSELKYNAWFSVASSLAFVLACLGIGWFRLSRIDF